MYHKIPAEIETDQMAIRNNTLSFENHFLQISNISQVSKSRQSRMSYSKAPFILIIIGAILLALFFIDPQLWVIALGLILIAIGSVKIAKVDRYNRSLGGYLTILLNSGSSFHLYSPNYDFLDDVMKVIMSCADSGRANYVIDLKNSVITVGNYNKVNMCETPEMEEPANG